MATQTSTGPTSFQIPYLEPGDHLTRDEFERRYEAMPELKKAELIEGVVYMPSPIRFEQHSAPQGNLIWWLKHYCAFTPGVLAGGDSTVRLDMENEPQPDALMFRAPTHGGRVAIGPSGYIEGAPELVAEVAASTASFDLHTKLRAYRRNQVQEYIVWRVLESALDWFVLVKGDYLRLPLTAEGIFKSEVFPGLWLDPNAIVRGDQPAVLRVLQDGLASQEHTAFAAELRAAQRGESKE